MCDCDEHGLLPLHLRNRQKKARKENRADNLAVHGAQSKNPKSKTSEREKKLKADKKVSDRKSS